MVMRTSARRRGEGIEEGARRSIMIHVIEALELCSEVRTDKVKDGQLV